MSRRFFHALLLLTLGGCANLDPYASPPIVAHLERDDVVGYCARLFADIDRRIDSLAVRDAEATRIPGFPYLRVNRFSAALAKRALGELQKQAWRMQLHQLDQAARATELANAELNVDDLPRCRSLLSAADAQAFDELRSRAKVADNYSIALRSIGLYPLTRLPFAVGISNWHAATRKVFSIPVDALPVRGRLQRYAHVHSATEPLARPELDSLGVPKWPPAAMAALFERHAPVLEVDVAAGFDRPGALMLDADDRVGVDIAVAVGYTRLTYAMIGDLIYPQLVYTYWFSERPHSHPVDLLAGRLDAVVWRVTLDHSGAAIVYDSMHACGCYHLFFPTDKVRARDLPDTLDETLFVPQSVPSARLNEKIVLRIESGTHYLQRVYLDAASHRAGASSYMLRDERALTTLNRPNGGTRSAYGEDALIAGSERAERWFFWPMGIESAGQMRQWGHHATAFVGRRHFDDPLLFNAYFEVRPLQNAEPSTLQLP